MKAREGIWPARHAVIAASFLACAVVLGGGGSPNPGTELILQLLFVVAALAWIWAPARTAFPTPSEAGVWLVAALTAALPLAQLIPLPSSLWGHLDGQQDRMAALALVGLEKSWQPLSHAPSLTLAALLAMTPALFAFVATASLDIRGRTLLVGTIAAMALLTALVGAVQVSLGTDGLSLYRQYARGVVAGFQANRNSTADLLLIGLVATAAFLAPRMAVEARRGAGPATRRAIAIAGGSVLAVLLLAVVLTASRAGIALIPVALAGVCIVLRPAFAGLGRWRYLPLAAAGLLAALALLTPFAADTTLARVGQRFTFEGELRPETWRDGWFAMQRAWPVGVGIGGAQSALIAAERLEILAPLIPNRVHNDYLELALEAGIAGFAVLAAAAAMLVRFAWRTWRKQPEQRALVACGATTLAIVAAHSLVDYPLRSMALACLAGTGAGLLVAAPRPRIHGDAAAAGLRR